MKERNFNAFVIYKVYGKSNIVVNHVIKGNDLQAYNDAVNAVYDKWQKREKNISDIFLLTLPCVEPYGIGKPIFAARAIGTENEFEREHFENEYYKE